MTTRARGDVTNQQGDTSTSKGSSPTSGTGQKYVWTGIKDSNKRFTAWKKKQGPGFAAEEEYKIHIDWSIQDRGFVEPQIQKVWRDELKPPIYQQCLFTTPTGRVCAMRIAI